MHSQLISPQLGAYFYDTIIPYDTIDNSFILSAFLSARPQTLLSRDCLLFHCIYRNMPSAVICDPCLQSLNSSSNPMKDLSYYIPFRYILLLDSILIHEIIICILYHFLHYLDVFDTTADKLVWLVQVPRNIKYLHENKTKTKQKEKPHQY